jgi:hypothetical protein
LKYKNKYLVDNDEDKMKWVNALNLLTVNLILNLKRY